eukprot:s49_g24.t3
MSPFYYLNGAPDVCVEQFPQSLSQASVDFAGEVHTFKRSRHQDRGSRGSLESGETGENGEKRTRGQSKEKILSLKQSQAASAVASPAIASTNDPRDADDLARPPSP